MSVRLNVDLVAEAAYVRLSDNKVSRTRDVTDAVLVDLDEFGVVVGVEVLALEAEIPFGRLVDEFHVHSAAVAALRTIQPTVGSFIMTQGNDGSTEMRPKQLAQA